MLQTGSLSPHFFEKKSSSAMHKLSTGIRILFYLHKITACFRILLCSSTQIYYKMNCQNSAKIICTLYKIRAQQQWIEKQVFAISSHIYQTVSEDYLLLHKMSVPQSFAKHSYPSITTTSTKANATSHAKNWLQKSIWAYTATIIIIISPIVDTKPQKTAH